MIACSSASQLQRPPAVQVIFAVRTNISDDVAFLDALLATNPDVYRKDEVTFMEGDRMVHARQYTGMAPGRIYVRLMTTLSSFK